MFVDVTNLKKDSLCTFILAAAALGVHPVPKVGAEGIQSPILALEQKVHYLAFGESASQ
jgi:hypothetical protein